MVQLFKDAFVSGNFSAWNSAPVSAGSTATVIASTPNYAKFNVPGTVQSEYALCQKIFTTALTDVYVNGHAAVTNATFDQDTDRVYLIFLTSGTNTLAAVGWRRTAGVVHWILMAKNGSTSVTAESSATPNLNQQYIIEVHWSTAGIAQLFVDGVKICELTGIDTTYYGGVLQVKVGLPTVVNYSGNAPFLAAEADFYECTIADTYIGTGTLTYRLTVQSSPELNVPVRIDGTFVGNTPIPVDLPPGPHTVSVDAEVDR